MNLSRKIILSTVSCLLALVFIVSVISDVILLKSYARLEQEDLQDTVHTIHNELAESFPELIASAKIYAGVVQKSGFGGVTAFSVDSFNNHRVDIVALFDAQNADLIGIQGADFHQLKNLDVTDLLKERLKKVARYCVKRSGECKTAGFVTSGNVVVQIALRKLDDGAVVIVGRYLDREEIARISALSKLTIEFHTIAANGVDQEYEAVFKQFTGNNKFYAQPVAGNQIAGYLLLHDIEDAPALVMKVVERRVIYEQGKLSVWYVLMVLVVCSLIFGTVMLLFMRGTILNRLLMLTKRVQEISRSGDVGERLEVSGDDELMELTVSINSMLASLEYSEKALKESETQYRELFERAPDAILVIGMDGDEAGAVIAANQAAAEQHGYTVAEMCRLKIYDLNTDETNLIAPQMMSDLAAGEWITRELWHRKKDGSQFPIEVHAGIIKVKGRRYILGFDRDITLRKLAEESSRMYLEQTTRLNQELSQQAASLVLANAELETFNYSVSHDIRGPLTRISGYCQLLLEENGIDQQSRTYISRIYESSCWMDELINAMLDLSRLSQIEFTPQQVDLSRMVYDAVQEVKQAEPQRDLLLLVQPGILAYGDAVLLQIAVNNLVGNAWKYSSHKAKTVIEFGVRVENGVPAYFIRDEGAGFDMRQANKLFRVFARLHDASQFRGTGIGLATVQRVIARHGGKIWAEAVPGAGATFFFTLAPGNEQLMAGNAAREGLQPEDKGVSA